MELTEKQISRWLERGGKFFRTVGRNAVVRATLLERGLSNAELARGWALYSELLGFGRGASVEPAREQTAAAAALNEIDAWDAPAFSAARAVLDGRFPEVSRFLFADLSASTGAAAAAGVERFLDRIDVLREGKADGVGAKAARAAVELLATRKIFDSEREARLRELLEAVRRGAQPEEVIVQEENPGRTELAQRFVEWLHEWREVARVAIARRDFRISLGLAERRRAAGGVEVDDTEQETEPEQAT